MQASSSLAAPVAVAASALEHRQRRASSPAPSPTGSGRRKPVTPQHRHPGESRDPASSVCKSGSRPSPGRRAVSGTGRSETLTPCIEPLRPGLCSPGSIRGINAASNVVIPAKAGTQLQSRACLGPGLRRNDETRWTDRSSRRAECVSPPRCWYFPLASCPSNAGKKYRHPGESRDPASGACNLASRRSPG